MTDDFEVSIFLTEHSTRHSVLTKQKAVRNKTRLQSKPGNLTNWLTGTGEQPEVISDTSTDPIVIREEDEDEVINLDDVPEADGDESEAAMVASDHDQKKKLGLNTSYEGFSIYGRILCLVVKRKGARNQAGNSVPVSSQQMLETWVSTQAAAEQVDDDEDIG